MATIQAVVFKHHKKADGTYNVKIRVTHNREKKYLDTIHFVTDKQLNNTLEIKDYEIKKKLEDQLFKYRKKISLLGSRISQFTASTLKDYLEEKEELVDFAKFIKTYIDNLIYLKRIGSAKTMLTVYYSLKDYFKSEIIPIALITDEMLLNYERYLKGGRVITRPNQLGKANTRQVKGLSNAGLHNHLRDFKILFKAAIKTYNKPHLNQTPILYNPFDYYKIVQAPETKKKALSIETIKAIRNCHCSPGSRSELARDMFMLSFYMCGINAVDIYNLTTENFIDGRLNYNRIKTKERRKDNAFISVKIIQPAKVILNGYINSLRNRYTTNLNLNRALLEGLKLVCKELDLESITFYAARHSFATIARNICGFSKDDVGLALNHVDHNQLVTDIYIAKDWSIIDRIQLAILELL